MKKILSIFLFVAFFAGEVFAANGFEIVAVVDGEAISSFDVDRRIDLTISSSGMAASSELRDRMFQQILKTLIDEVLYTKEAERLNIAVSDIDVRNAMATLEKQNGIKAGSFKEFLKSKHIPEDAAIDQIKKQLLWQKMVARKIRPNIFVSDMEVEEQLEHISNSSGISELKISEIILPVDDPEDSEKVKRLADKLVGQIREGADFGSVAKEFSKSGSASESGDLGWLREEQIPEDILQELRRLQTGQVSDPFYSSNNYYIVRLDDRRALLNEVTSDSKILIKQALVEVDDKTSDEVIKRIVDSIGKNARKFKSCDDFQSFAIGIGSVLGDDIVKTSLGELNGEVRNVIANTRIGELTQVIRGPKGMYVFAVCEKEKPKASLVLEDNVKEMLLRKKLDLQSQAYLRDLRQKAFIEIR